MLANVLNSRISAALYICTPSRS